MGAEVQCSVFRVQQCRGAEMVRCRQRSRVSDVLSICRGAAEIKKEMMMMFMVG